MRVAGIGPFNLGPRLTMTFVILIALILGGNGLIIWQFQLTRNEARRLTGANQQLNVVLQLQASLLSLHRQLDDLARSVDVRSHVTEAESLREALERQIQDTRTAVSNLPSGTVVNPSFLPTLNIIRIAYSAEIEAIVELAKVGDRAAIQPRVDIELNPIETQIAILVNSVNQQANGELERGIAEMASVQRRILVIVPATALATFLIAAFFGWSIARRFIELRLDERVAERTRIARELHDTLLQSLHGLLFQFQAARNMLPNRPQKAMETLDGALNATEQAITESRGAIHDLRAEGARSGDLAESLRRAAEELANSGHAQLPVPTFKLLIEGERKSLAPILQDEVYRVALEVLRNAFQHSGGNRIEMEIHYDDEVLRLRIRDNGKGIDPQVLKEGGIAGHWGLRGVRERAKRIGAKVDFWSEARAGTEVELTVPGKIVYQKLGNQTRFRLFRRAGSHE